ncbi:MAG: hypothetical protein IB617_02285 [Candidatus Nealsonbacteria bacterium]|nr:MAG: hypothetical protein IB617_02285 [Candidatus Nealsonbacteria bacterium]
MKKKNTKNTTINQLARMIKRGFDGVDKNFNKADKRFDKIETKITNLENGQEEIKLKLDRVAYRFEVEELDRRLKRVESKLGLK